MGEGLTKRGAIGEQATLPMFLFLLVLVAGTVIAGNFIFFGKGYDLREGDARALDFKTKECFNVNKVEDIFVDKDSFFEKCRVNKEGFDNQTLALKVCFVQDKNCELANTKGVFQAGSNFEACSFEGAKKNNAFQKCFRSEVSKDGKSYTLLTWSNQLAIRESAQ